MTPYPGRAVTLDRVALPKGRRKVLQIIADSTMHEFLLRIRIQKHPDVASDWEVGIERHLVVL